MLNVRQSFLEEALGDLELHEQKKLIGLLNIILSNLEKMLEGDDKSGEYGE